MNKYERLRIELEKYGIGGMKCFGNSMLPLLKSGSYQTFVSQKDYGIGDIVFCRVKGRWIDSHLITQKDTQRGWMISNNHGWQNGWTKQIFGRVVKAENLDGSPRYFNYTEKEIQDKLKMKTEET